MISILKKLLKVKKIKKKKEKSKVEKKGVTENVPKVGQFVNPLKEAKMLQLLTQAEKRRQEAWKYIQRKKTMHTKIPIYTGNPFTVD